MNRTIVFICMVGILSVSACNRDRGGVIVEVEGTLYTDSTRNSVEAGREVILFDYPTPFFLHKYHGEVESVLTDSSGAYFMSAITEENRSYSVWPKPDIFQYASGRPIRISEWRANTVDLNYVVPTVINLDIRRDSMLVSSSDPRECVLLLEMVQSFILPSAVYFSEDTLRFTIHSDTIIPLYSGPNTTISAVLLTDDGSELTWNADLVFTTPELPDTIAAIMTR